MSWEAQQAVMAASRQPGRFTDAEFRVLLNLADHLNRQTGRCDPGRELLAKETGKERGYLRRILRALEDRGEIRRRDPSSKGGSGHRQQYDLLLKGDWEPPFVQTEGGTGNTRKGDSGHHRRGTTNRADLGERRATRKLIVNNQRERAGSTPNGAGRARVDEPTPPTEEVEAAVRAAIQRGATG